MVKTKAVRTSMWFFLHCFCHIGVRKEQGQSLHNRKNPVSDFLCQEVDKLVGRGSRIQLWDKEKEKEGL